MAGLPQAFALSLFFAATATLSALLLAMVLILLRCLGIDAYLRSCSWKKLGALPDTLASVCESIPLLILLILLGQTGIRDIAPLADYLQKALILGLFMFPSVWRYLDQRLDLANEEVYPLQLMLWKIPSLRVGLHYVLLKSNLSGWLSSLLWVLATAFALDLSMGFISEFGIDDSLINWHSSSLGAVLGKSVRELDGLGGGTAVQLLLVVALLFALYQLTRLLAPLSVKKYVNPREVEDPRLEAEFEFKELELRPQGLQIKLDPGSRLTLREREFVWLNGPSGSGKSLFIKAVMGMLYEDVRDEHLLHRVPVIHYRGAKLSQATVIMPQEPDLYIFPYLSVRDYLDCMIGEGVEQLIARFSRDQATANRDNLIRLLKTVDSIQNTQVRNLSAGEKRMVALVVAIAQSLRPESKLVILDEPDSSLDQNGVLALKYYLSRINRCSVLYVTHNVLHSRDLYEVIQGLGIWQLQAAPQHPEQQLIHRITEVSAHYDKIHSGIRQTLDQLAGAVAQSSAAKAPSGDPLLKIRFPLSIRVGSGLKLGASFQGRPVQELAVRGDSGIVGIVGDNGIGKSSLLRAVMGLYELSEESVALGGGQKFSHSLSTHRAVYQQGLCYVFDDIEKALPENIPLSKVLGELLDIHGGSLHLTQYIGQLGSTLQRPLTAFSGGERQKIVFDLVCHVLKPRLLIMDEPFSRLDWGQNLIEVCHWLLEKARTCPILIISHNREILEALAPNSTWQLERL